MRKTLINLCKCYLDTNYLTAEDICNCLWYGINSWNLYSLTTIKTLDRIISPIREEYLEAITSIHSSSEDYDLEKITINLVEQIEKFLEEVDWWNRGE